MIAISDIGWRISDRSNSGLKYSDFYLLPDYRLLITTRFQLAATPVFGSRFAGFSHFLPQLPSSVSDYAIVPLCR